MSRKKRYRSKDAIEVVIVLFAIGMVGLIKNHKEEVEFYGYILLGIMIFLLFACLIVWLLLKRRRKYKRINYEKDDHLLYMFKGMPPVKFEKEIAGMFYRLGYKTKHVGKTHDGGIDVIAKKDKDEYLIQCKRYGTSVAGSSSLKGITRGSCRAYG